MGPFLSRAAIRTASATLVLLLVPMVAMRFTTEVNWGLEDFAAAGALIFGAGMTFAVATQWARSSSQRLAAAAGILAAAGAVWAQLAVGLFD